MTSIKVDQRDSHFTIEISGHANYAPKGQDIVCAGISLLSFMIHKIVLEETKVISDIFEEGFCRFAFVAEDNLTQEKIKTITSGYQMLSEVYPNYVSFTSTDVEI